MICKSCGLDRAESAFPTIKGKKKKKTCRKCKNSTPHGKLRCNRRAKQYRLTHPENCLRSDCRKFDKRNGFITDLSLDYIRAALSGKCYYCGLSELKMTLDRIDNHQGHTESNTNPCCIRCNYIRGSMPYAAWAVMVPAIKKATVESLFGNWNTVPTRNRIHSSKVRAVGF